MFVANEGGGGGNENAVNVGAIVGGVIGGLILVTGIVVASLFAYWRYEPKEDEKEREKRVYINKPYCNDFLLHMNTFFPVY